MQIAVNNQECEVADDATVSALIQQQGINAQAIAVAVNQKIIHRESWREYRFNEGDRVDIVTVVAGG